MPGLGLQGAYGGGALHDELLRVMAERVAKQQYADKLRQQDLENQQRQQQIDLQRENAAAEQARWTAQDQIAAQTRNQNLANQVADELAPGMSISAPTAGVLRTGGRGDLVRENAPNPAEGFLTTAGQPDYVPGEQPGTVYKGTAGQLRQARTDERLEQAAHDTAESRTLRDQLAASNAELTRHREARLTGWGPPTVVIADPNVPGGVRVISRSDLPEGGAAGPQTGTARGQETSNEVGFAQLDNLEHLFNAGAKNMIGPAAGRARAAGQHIPGVPVNKTFSDFEAATATFRNAVIKAITGAQMSEREADRIRQQIPDITDKPEVWQSKAAQTRANLQMLQDVLRRQRGAVLGGGTSTTGTIRMIAPDGRLLNVPANKVAEMEALGAKRQ